MIDNNKQKYNLKHLIKCLTIQVYYKIYHFRVYLSNYLGLSSQLRSMIRFENKKTNKVFRINTINLNFLY